MNARANNRVGVAIAAPLLLALAAPVRPVHAQGQGVHLAAYGGLNGNSLDDFTIRRDTTTGTAVTRYRTEGAILPHAGLLVSISGTRVGVRMSVEWSKGQTYARYQEGQSATARVLSRTNTEYVVFRVHPMVSAGPFYVFAGLDARRLLDSQTLREGNAFEKDLKKTIVTATGGAGLRIGPRLALDAHAALALEPIQVRDNVRVSQAPGGTQVGVSARFFLF